VSNYFHGSTWAATNAEEALPILVSFAESNRKTTYTDLSRLMFRDEKYAHPLMSALGRLGKALESLSKSETKKLGTIPPVQLLVCNQKTGRPGNLALGFVGFTKAETDRMNKQQLDTIVCAAHQRIFEYRKWPHVLKALGLRPVTLNLPNPRNILPMINNIARRTTGEGEEHENLKLFLVENPAKIEIRFKARGDTEVLLLSGDRLNVSFRDDEQWVAVEVKGKNSPEADLVRGIFQCLKYRIVMAAQLRHESFAGGEPLQIVPTAILACGCLVPAELRRFAESLDVRIESGLIVPKDFVPVEKALRRGAASAAPN